MADEIRGAVTELGGGAEVGSEPDIFEGTTDDSTNNDTSGGGSEENDQQDGGERPSSEGDVDAGGEEEGGEEGEAETEDEGEGEGAEEGTREEEEEQEDQPEIDPATGKPKVATQQKKPQTEAEKEEEKTLNELYRQNPKLKEFLQQNPRERATFFKAAQINKLYPGGIDEAKRAKDWASDLFKIDGFYYGSGPEDFASKRKFLEFMWTESLGPDGKSTGHYESVAGLIGSDLVNGIEKELEVNPNLASAIASNLNANQVSTALEIVRRAVKLITGKPLGEMPRANQSTEKFVADPKMTPTERRLAEENFRLKNEVEQRNTTSAATAEAEFNKKIYDTYSTSVKPEIEKRIPGMLKTNQLLTRWFTDDLLNRLHEQMRTDEFFDAQLASVARSGGRDQNHVQRISDMMKQRALVLLPTVVQQLSDELKLKASIDGGTKVNGSQKTTGRGTERPRREPSTSGSPGRLTRTSGKSGPNGQRSAGRTTPVKSTGDYMRDANKLLGIE